MTTELSRGELLAWVNDLTGLNLPKLELMGTGAAYCLIFDSIFGGVSLHKVNFKAIHDYEYVQNFKVLQEVFTRHRLDREIPVDRLIKLKFQDNLEFLQWVRKFWECNFDPSNGEYDAARRRAECGATADVPRKTSASSVPASALRRESSVSRPAHKEISARPIQSSIPAAAPAQPQAQSNVNTVQLAALTKTITELKLSVDEMEKERDFYFNKLRDIEILTQKVTDPTITQSAFFKQVTEILYTTEEGFEIPAESMETASVKAL